MTVQRQHLPGEYARPCSGYSLQGTQCETERHILRGTYTVVTNCRGGHRQLMSKGYLLDRAKRAYMTRFVCGLESADTG